MEKKLQQILHQFTNGKLCQQRKIETSNQNMSEKVHTETDEYEISDALLTQSEVGV